MLLQVPIAVFADTCHQDNGEPEVESHSAVSTSATVPASDASDTVDAIDTVDTVDSTLSESHVSESRSSTPGHVLESRSSTPVPRRNPQRRSQVIDSSSENSDG